MSGYVPRFSGILRLFGKEAQTRLHQAHVCVVGVGGVGSWTVEALARTGIGTLTLVDLDDVCISNTNRQLHAITGQTGRPKVEVMAERVRSINPEAAVHPVHQFFTRNTADSILATPFSCLVDAIDHPDTKCLLIAECRRRQIPVVTVGGAGGRQDPTRIQVADLAHSTHDGLLQEVRRGLRRDHGFPRGAALFHVEAVFSTESPVFPTPDGCVTRERSPDLDLRLDCRSGYGTATFVTGAFGFAAAAAAVQRIVRARP
jgi:tRNA A37 threonylcarbamoyladenosine dehydratase